MTDPELALDHVHVLSCVGARDIDLIGHFVAHYEGLGVPRSRIHLIVHAARDEPTALELLRARLAALGMEPASVWRGVYTSGGLWQRRRALQRRLVGPDHWVVNADVDELHVYPAPLAEVVAHLEEQELDLLQGPMIDRLARDGSLAAVVPLEARRARPLLEQFPVAAEVMCRLGDVETPEEAAGTVKMMLHRGDVLPGIGGHAPWVARHGPWRREGVGYAAGRPLSEFAEVVDPDWRFAQPAAVHHVKWTAGLADAVLRRHDAKGASPKGSAYGRAVLDYLEAHDGRIDLDDVVVAGRPEKASAQEPRGWGRILRRGATGPDPQAGVRVCEGWQQRLSAMRETPEPPLPSTPRLRPLSEEPPHAAPGWRVRRLTEGTDAGLFHTHSYYDIPVLDDSGTLVAAHQARIEDRWMTPADAVTVGVVDLARGGFQPIAETTAWSWQQGPLAQWIPGTRQLVWNHREGDGFVAKVHDVDTGSTRTLPRSVYGLSHDGSLALGLDMARLSRARPGYGYFGGDASGADVLVPADEGVWAVDLAGDQDTARLVLSLAEAVEHLHGAPPDVLPAEAREQLVTTPHLYWFNHVKLAPGDRRFTVKLRWRVATLERPWQGTNSISVTAGVDGSDVRLLRRAASHVMWRDAGEVVLWDEVRERVSIVADHAPYGELVRDLPVGVFDRNVHIHPLAGAPGRFLYDVPYAETVQLRVYDDTSGTDLQLAALDRHLPAHGPFRCDLHPVPTPDGATTVFTSLHDGGRQVYVLEREDHP